MKFFDDPTLEIIKLNIEEILTTSFGTDNFGENEINDGTDDDVILNNEG